MTVSTLLNRKTYACDGSTTDFVFPYPYQKKTDLLVILITIATGEETELVLDTDYSVTEPDPTGGTVTTFTTYSSDYKLLVYRKIELKQDVDLVEGGKLPAEPVEAVIDKIIMIDQQLSESIGRTVIAPISLEVTLELPSPDAGKTIKWNATADGFINSTHDPDQAQEDAEAAKTAAETARTAAETAQTNAETAETNAETAEANALAHKNKAQEWAEKAEDSEVEAGKYSALHWAAKAEELVNHLFKRAKFTYNGGATAYTVKVGPGAYFCKDKYCEWTSELTTNAISSPSADTFYYLYLDYSAITSGVEITANELIWSATAPGADGYNGNDRCVFGIPTNGTPDNILEFFHDGDQVFYADDIVDLNAVDIATDWSTVATLTIPAFARRAQVFFNWQYQSANMTVFWRTHGQTGTTGHEIAYAMTNAYPRNTLDVITDSSQRIDVKENSATTNQLTIQTVAWYFPSHI